jgi:predicted NAD-dependent protein-ADP-ribosyltransferase YbiA (DUF1768 family)
MSVSRTYFRKSDNVKIFHCEISINYYSTIAQLLEASPSTVWGTGKRLHEKDATTPGAWSGKNLMGNILMKIREQNVSK